MDETWQIATFYPRPISTRPERRGCLQGQLIATVMRPEIELVKFHSPPTQTGDPHVPANTPGLRHLAFLVDDIDAGLQARGTELVGELVRYEDSYRLCYIRGPEGLIVELAEKID